ncbi:MAG: ribbon-helix-helix domain-containing protein [Pyrinomonadaceae bacterium]
MNQALKKTSIRGSPKNEKEKIRLSLDISPELNALLEQLAAKTGGTKSDVLRKAIALMEVAVDAKRRGLKLGLAEKDQQLATEIIGL